MSLSGSPWPTAALAVPLEAGLNLVSYPARRVPAALATAGELLRLAPHATCLARLVPAASPGGPAHFEVYLPGLTPAFPIQPGQAYLLVSSAPGTLQLPPP